MLKPKFTLQFGKKYDAALVKSGAFPLLSKQEESVDAVSHPPVMPPVLAKPHLHASLLHIDALGSVHWTADPHMHVPETHVPTEVTHAGLQEAATKAIGI
jgi:hypothetical protein